MLQVVVSPMIISLMSLEVSFVLLENIYSTSVTYDCHLNSQNIFIVQATGINDLSFYKHWLWLRWHDQFNIEQCQKQIILLKGQPQWQ